MRQFQLIAQAGLCLGESAEGKAAILELVGEQGLILLVIDRLFLAVQQLFDAFNNVSTPADEQLQ